MNDEQHNDKDGAFAERLRAKLKEASNGEPNTWGFVAMFMDMIDEVERECAASETPPSQPAINEPLSVDPIINGSAVQEPSAPQGGQSQGMPDSQESPVGGLAAAEGQPEGATPATVALRQVYSNVELAHLPEFIDALYSHAESLERRMNDARRELAEMERHALEAVALNERQAINFAKCQEELAAARAASVALKLDKPAWVGNTSFSEGIAWGTVIARAQREYEYQNTPEKKAARAAKTSEFLDALREGRVTHTFICEKCGADRFKEGCRMPHAPLLCPLRGDASGGSVERTGGPT